MTGDSELLLKLRFRLERLETIVPRLQMEVMAKRLQPGTDPSEIEQLQYRYEQKVEQLDETRNLINTLGGDRIEQ